jgi:hypothetical protein
MEFNIDLNKKTASENSYELLPKGSYEMVIYNATIDASKNGHDFLNFDFLIRDDLDKALPDTNGKYHKRHFWASVWYDVKNGCWRQDDLANIAAAVGYSQEQANSFKTFEDFINSLIGKAVRVYLWQSENEYNGETTKVNSTMTKFWSPTKFKLAEDPFKDNEGNTTADIKEEDLPF